LGRWRKRREKKGGEEGVLRSLFDKLEDIFGGLKFVIELDT
jgi:hypothetical protein